MRIEKRFAVIGHELDGDVSPLEAGMEFSIDWEKDFIGREALLERKEKAFRNSGVHCFERSNGGAVGQRTRLAGPGHHR